jgi:hypothetical protein
MQNWSEKETNQLPAAHWQELIVELENCQKQLSHIAVKLAELKRTGPRDCVDEFEFNRLAMEREIETIYRLASSCAANWSTFHSKNLIVPAKPARSLTSSETAK